MMSRFGVIGDLMDIATFASAQPPHREVKRSVTEPTVRSRTEQRERSFLHRKGHKFL
jgi:hypothetical protein